MSRYVMSRVSRQVQAKASGHPSFKIGSTLNLIEAFNFIIKYYSFIFEKLGRFFHIENLQRLKLMSDTSGQYFDDDELADFSLKKYLSSNDLLQDFVDMIVRKTNSEVGYLHFYDEVTDELNLKVWSGTALTHGPVTHHTHYHATPTEVWTRSIQRRSPDVENNSNKTCLVSRTKVIDFEVKNYISYPILIDDKIVAVLGVGNKPTPYDSSDLDKLHTYIKVGWPIIIDLLKGRDEDKTFHSEQFLKQSQESILIAMTQAIGKALELRDEYTTYHQENVTQITSLIAKQLGLSQERRLGLKIGSNIHDIGKIAVPSQMLNKTGDLLPAEFEIIKLHANYGKQMFDHLTLPWPIADMIGQHHERMDGSGYPNGLMGNSICLEARIIAIADTYDAMAGDRPYRRAPGHKRAMSTLHDGRVSKFDPYVVDAFVEILDGNEDIQQLYV